MAQVHTLADGRSVEYAAFGAPDGRPVLFCHGTPGTCDAGRLVDESARSHGLRVLAVTRPGYGGSATTPPSLASTARDALELADALGLERLLAHGSSGGGPYAVAVAAVAPDRVDGVLVSAGNGRMIEVAPQSVGEEDRAALELAADGDVDGATSLTSDLAQAQMGALAALDPEAFAAAFGSLLPPGERSLDDQPGLRRILLSDVWRALRTFDGIVRDNLAWGMDWDVDLAGITAPTLLVHGDRDDMVPAAHGAWLAERIPSAERILLEGADHGAVTMLRLDEQYARLLAIAR